MPTNIRLVPGTPQGDADVLAPQSPCDGLCDARLTRPRRPSEEEDRSVPRPVLLGVGVREIGRGYAGIRRCCGSITRFGPSRAPSREAFSGLILDYVVMGGFATMSHCGHPHLDAFAHELGHFFGLSHTFPAPDVPGSDRADDAGGVSREAMA